MISFFLLNRNKIFFQKYLVSILQGYLFIADFADKTPCMFCKNSNFLGKIRCNILIKIY